MRRTVNASHAGFLRVTQSDLNAGQKIGPKWRTWGVLPDATDVYVTISGSIPVTQNLANCIQACVTVNWLR